MPIRKRIDRQNKLAPIEGDIEAYDALFTNNSDDFIKNTALLQTTNFLPNLIQISKPHF